MYCFAEIELYSDPKQIKNFFSIFPMGNLFHKLHVQGQSFLQLPLDLVNRWRRHLERNGLLIIYRG